MEHKLEPKQLSEEKLPDGKGNSLLSIHSDIKSSVHILDDENNKRKEEQELLEKVEKLLLGKVKEDDKAAIFQLGQFYFESERYEEAKYQFEKIKDSDFQAQFQLGIIFYDGLGTKADPKRGFEYMLNIANSTNPRAHHLLPFARYNVGRAFFEGFGVKQSDAEAERWWLLAADDGNPKGSIKAQTALGMYYSREDSLNLKQAFFWHSEATGNGSLESQGALGVMYQTGQGVRRDFDSAFECLKEASERGNVYAMGHLVGHFYGTKMYTKAAELALRLTLLENIEEIKDATDCLPIFISKGIAMGCFYYARCLHIGQGVKKDKDLAQTYYSKAFQFDGTVTQRLQDMVTHGVI
ncbi:putative LRP2-binding protein [Apostichopus japonicus]|uniref:LRP2-binding protein n=2 Tax=Stichopus japonicus TaxID=307972 RepID=A0A2G8K062_STIJA|nr:putative LRP2-binding protein [Apostichopus japonicus]